MKNSNEFNVMDFARPGTKVERIKAIGQFAEMIEITVSRSKSEEADFWAVLAALGGEDVGEKYQFIKLAGIIVETNGKPEFCLANSEKAFWWDVLKDFSDSIGVVFWVHDYTENTKILVNIIRK